MSAPRSRLTATLVVLAACQEPFAPDRPDAPPPAVAMPAIVAAAGVCQPPVPAGLVAWWRAEGDGADAVAGNHATAVGTVGYGTGRSGQGFVLDGSGYLEVPDAPALDLADSFSLDFWFEPRSLDAWWFEGLIGKRDGLTEVTNFGVNLNSSVLGIGAYYNDPATTGGDDFDLAGSTFEAVRAMPTPALNVFHHLAAVYRQATPAQVELRLYVDGTLVRSRTIDGDLARTVNDAPLTLGASYPGIETFNGVLDEVRLFDRALTDAEVAGFAAPGTPTCGPLPLAIEILSGDAGDRLPCRNPLALVTVAVLSTSSLDAATLVPGSARFGPAGATEVHRERDGAARTHREDVNRDGRGDLVLHFRFGETGLECGSTEAILTIGDAAGADYRGTAPVAPQPELKAARGKGSKRG
jgi:hypothetical protein